jgi:hypothetical protein
MRQISTFQLGIARFSFPFNISFHSAKIGHIDKAKPFGRVGRRAMDLWRDINETDSRVGNVIRNCQPMPRQGTSTTKRERKTMNAQGVAYR